MIRQAFAIIAVASVAAIVGCYRPDPIEPAAGVSAPSASSTASMLAARPTPSAVDSTPSASLKPTPSPTTSSASPSSPTASGSATAGRPTSTSSARIPYDRFTPPDRGLPPAMQTALNNPPSSRSPRSPKATRTRVLAAPESSGGISGISFDDLVFDILPDQPFDPSLLNDGVRSLFNRQVKIRGYILPQSVLFDKGNSNFILVRDNQECCFGPGAALYDCIYVQMKPGHTADFRAIPIAATGTFRFQPYQDSFGKTRAVFLLEAEAIE